MAKKVKRRKKKQNKLLSVLLVLIILAAAGFGTCMYMISPMEKTGTDVTVEIPYGSSTGGIADILAENGLVRSPLIYKIYIKLNGSGSQLKSGTYTLNTSMDVKAITAKLIEGVKAETVTITVREGLDVYRIADYLETTGLFTADEFLSEIENNFDYYSAAYGFLKDVPADRQYKLEGYLSGDTFEVYSDASPRDVIVKMLDRFDRVWKDEYYARCDELSMTVDEVVTMASIVEREGILDSDLPAIAGVFYNRLNDGWALESCATLQYIYRDYQYTFTNSQKQIDSPYNTYKYAGLPAGPISNVRDAALLAALYPDNNDYYFFCAKGDGTGGTAFARTLSEHEANISRYSGNWQ